MQRSILQAASISHAPMVGVVSPDYMTLHVLLPYLPARPAGGGTRAHARSAGSGLPHTGFAQRTSRAADDDDVIDADSSDMHAVVIHISGHSHVCDP